MPFRLRSSKVAIHRLCPNVYLSRRLSNCIRLANAPKLLFVGALSLVVGLSIVIVDLHLLPLVGHLKTAELIDARLRNVLDGFPRGRK